MEGLVRSESTFRRSGSSGLVWDDKFLSGELKPVQTKEGGGDQDSDNKDKGGKEEQQRQAYKTVEVTPTVDPPSPKVSAGCGICFGKSKPNKKTPTHKRSKPSAAAAHRKS